VQPFFLATKVVTKMARYQLTLAYDGTGFFGSQRQV